MHNMWSTVCADSEAMTHCEGQVGCIIHRDDKEDMPFTVKDEYATDMYPVVSLFCIPGYCAIGTKRKDWCL